MCIRDRITDELYDDLEEQLILADTGADVAMRLVEELRQEVRRKHLKTCLFYTSSGRLGVVHRGGRIPVHAQEHARGRTDAHARQPCVRGGAV